MEPAAPHPRRRPPAFDVAAAAALTAALLAIAPHLPAGPDERTIDALGLALTAVAGGSLAWRRVHPRAVLLATTAAVLLYAAFDFRGGPVYLTPGVAVFTLASVEGARRAATPAALTTVAVSVAGVAQRPGYATLLAHLVYGSWMVALVLMGDAVRSRALAVVALNERARLAEETREEEARRRVAEERVRIARDLHDAVAHSLASISIQAGMGLHVIERDPDEARSALGAIKAASREALAELRATLEVLREGEVPRAPTGGLDQLATLTATAEQAGIPVTVTIVGAPRPVPGAVDATAYRIVQEALTNVMRHAGRPVRVQLTVRYDDDAVELDVTDDGRGASPTGADVAAGGHGLLGMAERAALVGGEVRAGPGRDGGFRVQARLPATTRLPHSELGPVAT